MLDSIPYNTVPAETPFNIGVFLVNYTKRDDNLGIGEAYCKDFDLLHSNLSYADDATAIELIMKSLIDNS